MSSRYHLNDRYNSTLRDDFHGGRRRSLHSYDELDYDLTTRSHPRDLDFLQNGYGRSQFSGPLALRGGRGGVSEERIIEKDVDGNTVGEVDIIRNNGIRSGTSTRMYDDYDGDYYRGRRMGGRRYRGGDIVEDDVYIQKNADGSTDIIEDIRTRSRSRPGRSGIRDTEEIIVRHRSPRRDRTITEEVIVTDTTTPSVTTTTITPPVTTTVATIDNSLNGLNLDPIYKPPIHEKIHREVFTHHHTIDHGVEMAGIGSYSGFGGANGISGTGAVVQEIVKENADGTEEVDIIKQGPNGTVIEEEIITDNRGQMVGDLALRGRSLSSVPLYRRDYDNGFLGNTALDEADYLNNHAVNRSYPGEGYDGVNTDWTIVDVPPGTERIRLDGAGGSSQEITWSRYNGVRRSRVVLPDGEVIDSGIQGGVMANGLMSGSGIRHRDLWTEITKDLVCRDALDAMGVAYEETEWFYYVLDYLRYEDVLHLINLSDNMSGGRRRRIREMGWENDAMYNNNYTTNNYGRGRLGNRLYGGDYYNIRGIGATSIVGMNNVGSGGLGRVGGISSAGLGYGGIGSAGVGYTGSSSRIYNQSSYLGRDHYSGYGSGRAGYYSNGTGRYYDNRYGGYHHHRYGYGDYYGSGSSRYGRRIY